MSTAEEIIKLRSEVYRPTPAILAVLGIGVVVSFVSPYLAVPFGVVAFGLFYQRLRKAAHAPCPKCGAPFGTSAPFPIGVGTSQCQGCGLAIRGTSA